MPLAYVGSMKTQITAIVVAIALGATATASAGTKTLTGKFSGDSNAKVTIKVQTNSRGVATKVTSVSFSKVNSRCTFSEEGPSKPGPDVTKKLGSVKLSKFPKNKTGFSKRKDFGKAPFIATGTFGSAKATKVTGTVESLDVFGDLGADGTSSRPDFRACTLLGRFTAKAK